MLCANGDVREYNNVCVAPPVDFHVLSIIHAQVTTNSIYYSSVQPDILCDEKQILILD